VEEEEEERRRDGTRNVVAAFRKVIVGIVYRFNLGTGTSRRSFSGNGVSAGFSERTITATITLLREA